MKGKVQKLTVGIFVLILTGNIKVFGLEASQVKLPQENKKVYTVGKNKIGKEVKDYWLKVKLKPKVTESKVYWQEKEEIDWQKEIKDWKFGFLSSDENLPPIIIYKENFYPQEENFQGKFCWISNNARLLVLNPIDAPLKVNFIFWALSYKKKRELRIWLNGRKVSVIKVPLDKEDRFEKFVVKNIVLNPGKNEIIFYIPDGTDKLKPKTWEEEKEREVSIKFKDDFKFIIEKKLELAKGEHKFLPEYKYAITGEGLNVFVNFGNSKEKILLISRNTNIDLEEFPFLNLVFNIDEGIRNLDVFLGIDYNGDGFVDDYLNPEFLNDINLFEMAKEKWQDVDYYKYGFKLKRIILLFLSPPISHRETNSSILELKSFYFYNNKAVILGGKKFSYPMKTSTTKDEFISLIGQVNPELVKIDSKIFYLNDFVWHNLEDLERGVLKKIIRLAKGNHKYERLENDTFDVEWTILEPITNYQLPITNQEPEITFKKINPTKYLVKVEGAKKPFWLVFSESFHKKWKLYKSQIPNPKSQEFGETVADYPRLGVKEAKHLMKFTPQDIKYLFREPLNAPHHLVNAYANGWYIDPQKLGLGDNFILVIYFWPQSLFYLGLFISGATLLGCLIYLVYTFVRKKKLV